MYQKDIERDIRGVIKVAQKDDDHIYQELDEYVVTKELNKHLAKFYENYQKGIDGHTDKMGVWISGFFGSGKSHFLKILAYLLENQQVKGKEATDFFEEKIKDPIMLANMNRTAKVNTETILFNIDSKSSLDNKSKEDAILRIFTKVFNEHRGYYGDIPGVAEMEKYLDSKNLFDEFKHEFKRLSDEEWVDRRHTFYFDADYVVGALTKVTDMTEESARSWFENGVHNYDVSIEKFAKDVKEYTDERGENFHLVFLVDEIGQYIGDNRNLMLNLQTVSEDLATYCKGKVWIIVTSQESIDSIVKVKGDDFSRIQGRFDTRLSLSSISVDEVIKKRILLKKDYVHDKLRLFYPEKSAILKNLISFTGSAADLRGYDDETEFGNVYPFVPYQFKLLQNVFEQVRKHGSSGKHLSEGERSMLSAFKEAALIVKDEEEGVIVPFYAFYDTIKEFLNPSISRVIEGAKENPALKEDKFNICLLKVLFMIKYIKELPANVDNVATLMVTHIDEDKLTLKETIKGSLRKLIQQTLIQKNGEEYIFLTDDEQDINREIKAVNVDEEVLKRELANYIFDDLYSGTRFRYGKMYDFPYRQVMDEKNYKNQTASVELNILSPLSDNYEKSEQELMMMSSASDQLLIKLGGSESYIEEMREALQIDEYRIKRNLTQLPENIQNILNNKQAESRERKTRVKAMLEDAIKEGAFYINGDRSEIRGSTIKDKMKAGLEVLMENVYTKLGYVQEFIENERELRALLFQTNEEMTLDDEWKNLNKLARKEMTDYIKLQDEVQKQVRVKGLLDRYHDKPYGWRPLDIARMIVELLKEQSIRIRYHSQYLEIAEDANTILTVLTKTSETDKAIIIKRKIVDEQLIRIAKQICRELFNKADLADDEDGFIRDIRILMDHQIDEIHALKVRYEGRNYPGNSLLDKGLDLFGEFHKGLDNESFLLKLKEMEEDLLDWEEDVVYVKSFFENQKNYFDQGLLALQKYDENSLYISSEEAEAEFNKLTEIISDPVPYRKIKDIPELVTTIVSKIESALESKKDHAKQKLKEDFDHLAFLAKQYGVSNTTKKAVDDYYTHLIESIDRFSDIFKVDATISQSATFKERFEATISQEMMAWRRQNEIDQQDNVKTGEQEKAPITIEKEQVKVSELLEVRTLTTEEDVDQYVHILSSKLKKIIKANKHIQFID